MKIINKRQYYSRLRWGLFLAFFVFGLVPLVVVTWVTIANFRRCAVHGMEVTGTHMVEDRKSAISQYLKQQVVLLSTLTGIYSMDVIARQEHLDKLFLSINANGDVVDLLVLDAEGNQLAYVGSYRSSVQGKTYRDASWFKEVLISGEHVSDVFLGYREIPHLVVAVTDPLKKYVLRATLNSEKFHAFLFPAQVGPSGDAYIVNRKGEFQTPSLQKAAEMTQKERSLLESHEGASTKFIGAYIYNTVWLKNGQWLLVVKSKISESLGVFNKNIKNSLFVIFAAVSFIALSAILLARYMVARLEQDERKRAVMDQQMIQVEKMASIGRLAAGIAHEINNPLQLITNQAGWMDELLKDENPDVVKNLEEYRDAAKKIRYHVRRAGSITHRLLGFSRKMSTEKEFVNVNELIEETVSFVENEAGHHNIIIERHLDQKLPTTMTDGPQLQQVFLNLLNNGLDAISQDGQITINTKADATSIYMEFADNGPGISPEVMKQIFDPFFTTKEPGKGTGLGMSICYDIMEKLGGSIDVNNGEPRGAVFTLTLPIKNMGAPSQQQKTAAYG